MNAVSRCFPAAISLLCLWHANKAVLRYCQPSFIRNQQGSEAYQQGLSDWNEFFSHWHSIIRSADEETFDQCVQQMERKYLPQYVNEVGYIKATWLDLYKEKLVKAWVDHSTHFGNVVTSRVEGIHSLLKSHLKRSTLGLFEAWRAMKQALLNQIAELRYNQAKQQLKTPIELSGSLYTAIRGWISHEALRKVEEQRKRLLAGDLPDCTGSFTRSQGLPCAHTLKALQEQDQALRLEHFHTQWHLNRSGTHQLLLEPRHRSDRIIISSTKPQSSTRREPSAFEAVEAATRPRAQPKCSRCHTLGHTMASKACPLRHQDLLRSSSAVVATAETAAVNTAETAAVNTAAVHAASIETAAVSAAADQAAPAETAAVNTAASQVASAETVAVHAASIETAAVSAAVDQAAPAETAAVNTVASQAASAETVAVNAAAPALRYDHPQAIYQRYIAAREAWYNAQPRGSLKTNQQYRKAIGLPQRYSKASYNWCLDYKQMGQRCAETTGSSRDWTKEEMMAYLDWTRAEEDRVEVQVAVEMEGNMWSSRRGMRDIWEAAARDIEAQEEFYSGR